MGFTTSCFIRKNSKELQKKLYDIGYIICRCANFTNAEWINTLPINGTVHGKGYFDAEMEFPDWTVEKELSRFVSENPSYIDCEENEELFLAIAALRNDSDIHQWFVLDTNASISSENMKKKGTFIICKRERWFLDLDEDGTPDVFSSRNIPAHKATVSELIKHFAQ